jgi:hypothetical protein
MFVDQTRSQKSARRLCTSLLAALRILFTLITFDPAVLLAAQQALDSQPVPTIQSRTDLVLVPVVVRGKKGEHISGISKDSFHLEENGREQNRHTVCWNGAR